MNTNQLWGVVEDQRLRVAAFLEPLTDDAWAHPSLCDGWTVKDVAAHLAVVPHAPSLGRMLPMVPPRPGLPRPGQPRHRLPLRPTAQH